MFFLIFYSRIRSIKYEEEFFYGDSLEWWKKEEYLAEYHESGKSKSEFTREKDIPTTFQRWIDNENRSTYGMIDLNKLDKEKQQVMSNVLKPTVFASSKIKIELQEGYDKNLLRSVVEVLINDTKVIEWNNNNIYGIWSNGF